MITIAIDLNHVIRNINKQLLKYYQKDYHPEIDIDEIDEMRENVLEKYIKFESKRERNEFIYIDYPYEIFGCAKAVDKDLPRNITSWMNEMSNREDEEFRVMYYSLGEEALTIQSSYFFLSKLGTRVREVVFPKTIEELKTKCDVIISSDPKSLAWAKENDKIVVNILANGNRESDYKDDFIYGNMEDVISDDKLLDKLIELKK